MISCNTIAAARSLKSTNPPHSVFESQSTEDKPAAPKSSKSTAKSTQDITPTASPTESPYVPTSPREQNPTSNNPSRHIPINHLLLPTSQATYQQTTSQHQRILRSSRFPRLAAPTIQGFDLKELFKARSSPYGHSQNLWNNRLPRTPPTPKNQGTAA